MTWYTFFKSVHVIAAVLWVGGAATLQALSFRALRGDGRRQAEFAKDAEFLGMRVITPAAILVLIFGIATAANGDWPMGQNWITFGFIMFAASFVAGAGFFGPESGRIAKLIETRGPDAPEVGARIRRILTISRVELVFLVAVVWNMVVKPTGQPGWFWGSLAVTAAAAAAIVAGYRRSHPTPAPATE
jgi:uncharacterized membrane protein